MFTRSLTQEKATVAGIVRTALPDFPHDSVRRVNRGISNVKYWLTSSERTCLIKIYSGDRHRQRAAAEYSVMSLAREQSGVPVPEPVAWGSADDQVANQPISYVVMNRVEGAPLDEVIDLLTMEQVASLGAQTGVLLDHLHALGHCMSEPSEDCRAQHVPQQGGTPLDQLAEQARTMGILTAEQSELVVRLGSAPDRRRPSVLLHGDLGWDNIMVRTGPVPRVAALIDFEYSMLGAPEYDFVRSSVECGERADAFATALTNGYIREGRSTRADEEFRADVARAEILVDLRVALDLARGPFRDVYAMAATEHRAWGHVARLYRTLAISDALLARVPGPAGVPGPAAVRQTLDLARRSTCRVRQVGAIIFGPSGNEVASGLNDLRPTDGPCWCAGGILSPDRPRCPARHAEANAISSAADRGVALHDLVMLSSTCPCLDCARRIVRAGLREVVYVDDYIDTKGLDYLLAAGVVVHRIAGEPTA